MSSSPKIRVGLGVSSHRFVSLESTKPCILGGIIFEECEGFLAESDGDVVFLSICNAISSLTGVAIIKGIAQDLLYKDGITDSEVYLQKALGCLGNQKISHIALSIEAKRPLIDELVMRERLASVLQVELSQVGITSEDGNGLTDFSCGDGVQCMCILTTSEN